MPRRADAAVVVSRLISELTRSVASKPPYNRAEFGHALELIAVMAYVVTSSSDGRPRNASEIANHVGIPRSSVRRRLRTLIESGRIKQSGRLYIADFEFYDGFIGAAEIEQWFKLVEQAHAVLSEVRSITRRNVGTV